MNEKLIINDEVHGIIELEGVYKELVECEEFQRLKDIIQIGTSYLQYPEIKKETRFDHSVGSYHLMCKIIDIIEKKLAMQGIKVNQEEKEIAKIAILLHDIGHGAYSHTLEKITGYSHERRGIDIVEDEETKIHQILVKNYGEKFAKKVGEFLERVYEHKNEKTSEVEIKKGEVNLEDLLASLVSNNIDADRLDYLTRDSKVSGFKILTETDKLIESFETVLDIDKIIVAIPEENKLYVDMTLLERARNYRDIYYCTPSIIGDQVFEFLLEELRNNSDEVPKDINPTIRTFLTNSKANFSTKEHMEVTETPIQEALDKIKQTTKSETIKSLCDLESMTKSYQEISTNKDEKYIRYLLHKAIPEIKEDTKGLIEETRWIKPYKSDANESINIITSSGIEDYKDIPQDLVSLKPFPKRVTAISMEMLRLELGISKEEFDKNYKKIIEEVISTVTRSKDEFELRYVLARENINAQEMKERIGEKYEIVDSAKYMSNDVYYDNIDTYEMLENKESLRVRRGTTFHKSKETYKFKQTRATYKKYKKDAKSNFTIRRKEEEIGDTDSIETYKEFLNTLKIDKDSVKPILEVNNLRYLYTIKINGVLIDISFNNASYQNKIYEMFGDVGTIEIKPRDNKITDRLSLLEIREFLETEFPKLAKFLSNTNVYEIGVLDTYEKYKKGYVISEAAQEYEEEHKEAAKKIEEISKKAKQGRNFAWLNEKPKKEAPNPEEQGESR